MQAFLPPAPLPSSVVRRTGCHAPLCPVAASATATVAATAAVPSPVRFPGLRAARFQHPVDIRATKALRLVPALEPALRAVLSTAEKAMVMDGLATGVRVSDSQLPHLHKLLVDACTTLDLPVVPDLYIKQNPLPYASLPPSLSCPQPSTIPSRVSIRILFWYAAISYCVTVLTDAIALITSPFSLVSGVCASFPPWPHARPRLAAMLTPSLFRDLVLSS
jgi:hypothetical protein